MLGTCIVVLALLGTVLGGYTLGGFQDQRDVTNYDYITDVSGLFDVQQAPEYVSYNPNANINGYTPTGIIDYTPSSTVNGYRYKVNDGTTVTNTQTINFNSSYPGNGDPFPTEDFTGITVLWNGTGYDLGEPSTFSTGSSLLSNMGVWGSSNPYTSGLTNLQYIIQSLNLGTYATLDISISYGTFPVFFYKNDWQRVDIDRWDEYSQVVYYTVFNDGNSLPTRLVVNMASLTVTGYRYNTLMWTDQASNIDVIYKYSDKSSGVYRNQENASATLSISATTYPEYGYMDPTKGVSMDNNTAVHNFAITSSDSYTTMTGLFNTPTIPYPGPDQTVTGRVDITTDITYRNSFLSIVNDTDFKLGVPSQYTNVYARLYFPEVTNYERMSIGKSGNNFLVTTLGDWIEYTWPTQSDQFNTGQLTIYIGYTGAIPALLLNMSGGIGNRSDWDVFQISGVNITYQKEMNSSDIPTFIHIDFDNDVVEAYSGYGTSQYLWASTLEDVYICPFIEANSRDMIGRISADYTYTIGTTTTGPTYPIVYVDNTSNYNGYWTQDLTLAGRSVNTASYINTYTYDTGITSLKAIMNGWNVTNASEYIINLDQGNYPVYMGPTSSLPWTLIATGDYNQPWAKYYYQAGSGAPYTVIDQLVYHPQADTVDAYYQGILRWSADPDNVWVMYRYTLLDGSTDIPAQYQTGLAPVNVGIDIRAVQDESVTWRNGYKNDQITLALQRYDNTGNDVTIQAGSSYVTVSTDSNGYMALSIYNGTTTRNLQIGTWRNVQLTIGAVDGTLVITPLTSVSFTSPSPTNGATQVIEGFYSGDPIESLTFSTSGQSLRWQVTQTTVFLDTFNSVMQDPRINITDYFPDYPDYRLNFYSFAIYGTGMSINNVPMSVDRSTGNVTFNQVINGETRTVTHPLQNIYVTKEPVDGVNHTILTFATLNKSYDLGETVNDVVSFDGLWFFTTGLYDVVQTTEDFYNWNFNGGWNVTTGQALIIFLGLMVVGALVCKSLLRLRIGAMDGLIMGIGAIFSIIVIGGLV